MSGSSYASTLPAISLVTRASDNGEVLKITGPMSLGQVGDYFGDGVMTPVEANAVNLRGNSMEQSLRVTTPGSGLYTWTYATPFPNGVVPVVQATCEGPDPQSGTIVNAQVEGTPTNTSCKIRVTRSTTTIQVLGINVLSLSTAVATVVNLSAKAP